MREEKTKPSSSTDMEWERRLSGRHSFGLLTSGPASTTQPVKASLFSHVRKWRQRKSTEGHCSI